MSAARKGTCCNEGGTGTGGVRRVDGVDVAPRSVVLLKERGVGGRGEHPSRMSTQKGDGEG